MTKLRAILRRRWPVLVVTTVLGLVAGVVSTAIGPDRDTTQYQAEQVIVANRLSGNPANVPQDSLKVTRGEVPQVAAEALGQPERRAELARKVHVSHDEDSNSITLKVYDPRPEVASDVVQAFSSAFLRVVNAELRSEDTRQLEQLTERADQAAAALAAFDDENGFVTRPDMPVPQTPAYDALIAERRRLQDAFTEADRRLQEAELEISQREPYTTLGPENPRVADSQLLEVPESAAFRAGLLGLIGLILGAGLVFLIERINRRVDTREELAELINVPILAEIGQLSNRQRPTSEDGQVQLSGLWAEHYRRVRSAIQFVQADAIAKGAAAFRPPDPVTTAQHAGAVISRPVPGHVPRVFLFASALPSEGKSTSAALTAMALAESGDQTLLINADFRRPAVENYLGVGTSPSLADLAEMSIHRPSPDEVVQPSTVDHLWVAAAGPPTLEVKGRLQATRELASEAARRGGTVIIDSSPLRVTNDPMDLLSVVDEIILVVRAGRTTVKSLEDTIQLLDMHHAPVLGVLLIGTLGSREMFAYYDAYMGQAAKSDQRLHAQEEVAATARSTAQSYQQRPPAGSAQGQQQPPPPAAPEYPAWPQPAAMPQPPVAPQHTASQYAAPQDTAPQHPVPPADHPGVASPTPPPFHNGATQGTNGSSSGQANGADPRDQRAMSDRAAANPMENRL